MTGVPRSSFVRHSLARAGASFADVAGGSVAMRVAGGGDSPERARRLGLCDLSPLPRRGFRGPRAVEWLREQGVSGPSEPNRAEESGGVLSVSLSWTERLLLNPPASDEDACARLDDAWSPDTAAGCHPIPRADTHCWFAMTGTATADTLAKLCGVDLRAHRFPAGAVAQTMVADVAAIVVRHDAGDTSVRHVLADSASAEYLWSCLVDAMGEFDGAIVGLGTLRALL